MTRTTLAGALLLAAAALSGCGGATMKGSASASSAASAPPVTTTTVTATGKLTTHPPRRRHRRPRAPSGPPIGRAQQVITDGAHLTVTITHLIDPLTATGSRALPGTRQVGLQVQIDNHGPETYDSTASGDLSVVLSSGQAQPLDVRRGVCETQLVDFESHVYPGDVRDGCVGFSVSRHATVLAARFSPHSRPPGTLTWRARR